MRGGPPRKYALRSLGVGGKERVSNPTKHFRSYVYQCGVLLDRKFSVKSQADGSLVVTRVS